MKVEFSPGVMEERESFRYLNSLLWTFVDGRHDWVVPEVEAVTKSGWFQEESSQSRRRIRQLAEKFARKLRPVTDLLVTTRDKAANPAPPAAPARIAELYLAQPLVVLVENARCDGAFVRLIAHRVDQKRWERLLGVETWRALKQDWSTSLGDGRWLGVRHGGGNTTATQLELLATQASPLPPRVVVVLDSDRASQADSFGATADQVVQLAKKHPEWHVAPFVLSKREVENYIPEEVLKHRFGHTPKWSDYEVQVDKDHVDLKKYFGPKCWEVLVDVKYESLLHEQALKKRAGNVGQELRDLIQCIVSAL